MSRRIVFINALLLAAITLTAYQLVLSWAQFEEQAGLEEVVDRARSEAGLAEDDLFRILDQDPLAHDFFVIAERNLFREERRPPEEDPAEETVVEAPQFPKRPEMLGTTEMEGESRALLRIFSNARSEGETRSVRLGETVQGYLVSDMTPTTVTLAWNDVQEVIDMFDSSSQPQAQGSSGRQLAAVKIIRIGSSHSAVESTAPEEAERAEDRGLQVSSVGGQRGTGQGIAGRGAASNPRGGVGGAQRGFSGSTGNVNRNQGTSGLVGGSRNPIPRPGN